ncbi:MAG TPA: extracellular solute-binding protein [Anaerolineales bacterium]|nr:extracellular solute-binding protein [Anaerolineales bacterium]
MAESKSPLSRREFLKLAGTSIASAALAACSPRQSTATPGDGNPVQLVYQDWSTDWFQPMAQKMLEEFHDTHPHIRVFFTPDPDNLAEQMLNDMQAGIAPDVFQGCCQHFPTWAQKGYTLNLEPYVNADLDQTTIDDWNPAQYQAFFTKDKKLYGLPKYHGALALYYNKDLFDSYAIDYPDETWDHDDYLAAMQALTHDQNGDGQTDLWGSMLDISWDRIQIHVNGWGGHFVNPDDPSDCLMNEPEAMAALEWLRARMWDDKVMATNLDVKNITTRQAFINQHVAMVEEGSWALKDILQGATFRVGVAPFPSGPDRKVTLATTDGFGIYAGTKHPDEAWELVKFLISKDYGRAMARANFLQPARASLVNDWVSYIREEFPEKTKDMNIAAFADGHINDYSVTSETFANMAEATRLTSAAWEQIFTLGQSPIEQIQNVCLQIEAAQKEKE